MALQPGSVAINAGPDPVPAFAGNEFDQRGADFFRVVNGRVDIGETFTDPGDRTAQFDWGVTDVDSAAAGNQEVKTRYGRNGWTEDDIPTWWQRTPWPHEYVKFTTGPTTTSVSMYVDNQAYVGVQDDSDVTFDSFYVLPVVSPQRTLDVRPADGVVGTTTVTLTAKNAAGTTNMFSCLTNMPLVAGGQAPAARALSRIAKRSAASL